MTDRENEDPKADGSSALVHHYDNQGNPRLVVATAHGPLSKAPPADTSGISERTLVDPILRDIATKEEMLASTVNTLDPKTGRAALAIPEGTEQRRRLEVQLAHLRDHELPYARAKWAQINAERGSQPSTAEKLAAEKERQESIAARAQEIADEREAAAAAERITRRGANTR